jgi:hypothetical protein
MFNNLLPTNTTLVDNTKFLKKSGITPTNVTSSSDAIPTEPDSTEMAVAKQAFISTSEDFMGPI